MSKLLLTAHTLLSSFSERTLQRLYAMCAHVSHCACWLLLQCPVTCGKGYKHRQTWCQFAEDRRDDRFCDSASKPESVQTCQQQDCASWQVGPWGQVRHTCWQTVQWHVYESGDIALCQVILWCLTGGTHCVPGNICGLPSVPQTL